MKKSNYVLAIDPSGSYYEGKGVTGWCLFNKDTMKIETTGVLRSEDYFRAMEYYDAHVALLLKYIVGVPSKHLEIVIEDYLLYPNKAEAQSNSRMETCQLIGILKYICWGHGIIPTLQPASLVQLRWANKILIHKNYICPKGKGYRFPDSDFFISNHVLDAIRHAVHYATFHERKKEIC